jgi:HEAT repeat protein
MPDAPKISLTELRGFISDAGELTKGTQIADSGALQNLARHELKLFGEAKGSGQAPYRVSLTFGDNVGDLKARCSCMAARSRPFCKHSAALLVSWARSPESFVVSDAPPVSDAPARKKSVKTGTASGTDLMAHGVERVATLVRELAVTGIAAAGLDRVEQVRQLGEGLRENRLRRLSARTLELSQMLEAAVSRRGHVDAVAYADLLSDMLLTARKLAKHLAGEALEDRYVEELIGKSWRKTDRTPVEGLDLVEYAFLARVTADDFVIRESRFVDLQSGTHYSEKQILPAFMAKRSEPKRSYAQSLLQGAAGGRYPGFPPHRLDLDVVPSPAPLSAAHMSTILERAHANVSSALTAFQEHRRDVFAPDSFPVTLRAERLVADEGRFRVADAVGDALHAPRDPRLDEMFSLLLRRGRLLAVMGEMMLDGILATLVPMALVIDTADGPELMSLSGTTMPAPRQRHVQTNDTSASAPAWLEEARRAGVPATAIALGEVRLEMADALITGLAGLTPRVTEPLVSRLTDLGLDKPAAVLGELPAKADPADRLDGFVKVHQIAGLALVRLAGATTIDSSNLERLPRAESIVIRRPSAVLTPDELLAARLEGRLSRYEAAWHRSKHFERLSIDELLTEWPSTWGDGEAAPHIAETVASTGERAVTVAREVLSDIAAGQTAQLTALRVLTSIGSPTAMAIVKQAASDKHAKPLVRSRSLLAIGHEKRGWRALVPFIGDAPVASIADLIDRLTTATDKDSRVSALEALERHADERAIPAVRQAWLSDPAQDVRARAATTLGILGDSESVETFIAAFRNRATAAKEAKGALAALWALGDVRAVPDILRALIENWGGPLPAEALLGIGVPALESIMTLVTSRPDLAQRKSLQDFILQISASSQAGRLLCRRMSATLDASDGAERAAALLKLSAECESIREALARQILARVTAPSSKADKALVRAAQQALVKDTPKPAAHG